MATLPPKQVTEVWSLLGVTPLAFSVLSGDVEIASAAATPAVGDWRILADFAKAPLWAANTFIADTSIRMIQVAGVWTLCYARGDKTTGAAFPTETGGLGWLLQGQQSVPAWAANTYYLAGFKVVQGGQTYQAVSDFTSGAAFNAAEWTQLSTGVARTLTANWANVNAGTAVACGSIQLRMNTAQPRSLQILSNTGANLAWASMSMWEGGGSALRTGTATSNAWQTIEPNFDYSVVNQVQHGMLRDATNGRNYHFMYTVAASFNNSPLMILEF